ncbi:diphosphomevalonate decarboxylase [Gramella sp. AN32]|uniref:diphosphomevalonate decarboxylase n=1 Tax=Christiangramia antarctica TaxID=2058158 RepID=A0ABW5XBI3_9FLAO|nr:diphosphomevalonate decarboxylase [Gramella sp. AN32]MCM4155534.1 diphosphomevalonate decarboxylase [Gramella sp. AN32]
MREKDFIPSTKPEDFKSGKSTWRAPSNIALVKYWGKKENQIPANPSISFTLNNCHTLTSVTFSKKDAKTENFSFEFYFEGKKKESFKPKIIQFFRRIEQYCPYLKYFSLKIESENSFPHSSGIASSASGMSALSLCIMDLEKNIYPGISEDYFLKKASFLARLGSGSACRSIEGNLVVWGNHQEIEGSSDLFGINFPYKTHEVFKSYRDIILLVDKGAKQVSSTVGHDLMHGNPYAEARFEQANKNLSKLIPILKSGDLSAFIELVESEALSLHAVMLSSLPYFILMKPNTLEIINRIWAFRKLTGIPVCFTLDAGANVHMLYPEENEIKILDFIKDQLVAYCEKGQYICDKIGGGAKRIDH